MPVPTVYQISASKASTWLDCPRKFWFQYVARIRVPVIWAHLSLGTALHDTLRDWWDEPAALRTGRHVTNVLDRHWSTRGFRDQAHADQWRASAAAILRRYLGDLDPQFEPLSRERTLAMRVRDVAITARIDRLDLLPPGDAVTVVDYKTGKRVPGPDDVRGSMALALYALCVRQALHRPCSRIELHHVPSATVIGWEHSDEALQRHLGRVLAIADEMRAAEGRAIPSAPAQEQEAFPATPGPLCGWCDFRSQCPQGEQASTPQPSWAGLPEASDWPDPIEPADPEVA
ncbi:MAG: PD-(D/E)XK nuclease family protein [Actinomycetales bacterium]|nr:PD-(D/E)XK nuclease family protein [Actinomycetales bacterium]